MAAWRGIVAPKGIPKDVQDKLAAAVGKIAASKEYTEFMAKSDAELGATMKAVGLAK